MSLLYSVLLIKCVNKYNIRNKTRYKGNKSPHLLFTHTHKHIYTITHTNIHTQTYTQSHTHKQTHTNIYTITHTNTYIKTHTSIYIITHTNTHTHKHTHTNIKTHTNTQKYTNIHTNKHKSLYGDYMLLNTPSNCTNSQITVWANENNIVTSRVTKTHTKRYISG